MLDPASSWIQRMIARAHGRLFGPLPLPKDQVKPTFWTMVSASDPRIVGFLEINLGRTKVKVPIRESTEGLGDKDVAFSADAGGGGSILVRDGASEKDVERAMSLAAREACKHFSRKLLN